MNNHFDRTIQELLKDHTEQPSVDCWNQISSHLDALHVPNADAGSAASSGNASVFSQFIGSVTGKVVSALVAVAVIGGAIWLSMSDTETSLSSVEKTIQKTGFADNCDTIFIQNDTIQSVLLLTDTMKKRGNNTDTIRRITEDSLPRTVEHPIDIQASIPNPLPSQSHAKLVEHTKTETTAVSKAKGKQIVNNATHIEDNLSDEKDLQSESKSKQPELKIPNIFTPNGDYINDYFEMEGIEQLSENQLIIFHKDGRILYNKPNYRNDWDGANLPDGVYFYIFKFTYQDTQFMRNGSITIKR
jgi:gliding motility-associated-like protein